MHLGVGSGKMIGSNDNSMVESSIYLLTVTTCMCHSENDASVIGLIDVLQ